MQSATEDQDLPLSSISKLLIALVQAIRVTILSEWLSIKDCRELAFAYTSVKLPQELALDLLQLPHFSLGPVGDYRLVLASKCPVIPSEFAKKFYAARVSGWYRYQFLNAQSEHRISVPDATIGWPCMLRTTNPLSIQALLNHNTTDMISFLLKKIQTRDSEATAHQFILTFLPEIKEPQEAQQCLDVFLESIVKDYKVFKDYFKGSASLGNQYSWDALTMLLPKLNAQQLQQFYTALLNFNFEDDYWKGIKSAHIAFLNTIKALISKLDVPQADKLSARYVNADTDEPSCSQDIAVIQPTALPLDESAIEALLKELSTFNFRDFDWMQWNRLNIQLNTITEFISRLSKQQIVQYLEILLNILSAHFSLSATDTCLQMLSTLIPHMTEKYIVDLSMELKWYCGDQSSYLFRPLALNILSSLICRYPNLAYNFNSRPVYIEEIALINMQDMQDVIAMKKGGLSQDELNKILSTYHTKSWLKPLYGINNCFPAHQSAAIAALKTLAQTFKTSYTAEDIKDALVSDSRAQHRLRLFSSRKEEKMANSDTDTSFALS